MQGVGVQYNSVQLHRPGMQMIDEMQINSSIAQLFYFPYGW